MDISDMKQYVTHFSEQLRYAHHEEEVVMGGEIKWIIPPVNEEYPMYILNIDDQVGTSHVFVPDTMMQTYSDQLKIGNVVFLEGFVNIITRQINKEIKKDISVFAFSMKDITKVGHTKI